MKGKLPLITILFLLFFYPCISIGQAPTLGTTASFALFTAAGAFENEGPSIVIGDVGTNVGAYNAFPPGILIGQSHVADPGSAQAAIDVEVAYSQLSALPCGMVIGTTLGNNQVLTGNTYCHGAASVLNGNLILDGQGNLDTLFIFQINGAFSTSTHANIVLINGASLCNVYFQVNGAFQLGDSCLVVGSVDEQTVFEQLTSGEIAIPVLPIPVGESVSIE